MSVSSKLYTKVGDFL